MFKLVVYIVDVVYEGGLDYWYKKNEAREK